MSRQGECELCLVDAFAVVANTDELLPARHNIYLYGLRPCIKAVLDQFLHDGRRALDDLAGGDLVDQVTGKLLDGMRTTAGPPFFQIRRITR